MICPKCETELHKLEVDILHGFRGGELETLALGEMRIYACEGCRVAIMTDRPKEISPIIQLQ